MAEEEQKEVTEEKQEEEEKPELSEVEKAQKVLEELKAENARSEELRAKDILGGKSENAPQQEEAEESDADYAQRALEGKVEVKEK